ncbi:hypothetical protein GCM10009858_11970 [Terrabacter carboxydivorans]|uniref:Uncharacterized protein n=1 Tax=Terrabacter carboxydivorans TaxID=619730 RepID=A0ABP5YB04_9MICO
MPSRARSPVCQSGRMPSAPLTFELVTEPAEAQTRFAGLVAAEPEALSVLASVTGSLVVDPDRYAGPRWWAGTDASGEVVAAFMHTPPHPLHIALATPGQARGLASRLAAEGDTVPGVGGLREPAEAFADEWTARTEAVARVAMEVGRFDLPVRPRLPFAVEGSFRVATEADAALLERWNQQFVDAIEGGHGPLPGPPRRRRSGRAVGPRRTQRVDGLRVTRQRRCHPHLGRVDASGAARARIRERGGRRPECSAPRRR